MKGLEEIKRDEERLTKSRKGYPKVKPRRDLVEVARHDLRAIAEAWRLRNDLTWAEYLSLVAEEVSRTADLFVQTERGQ